MSWLSFVAVSSRSPQGRSGQALRKRGLRTEYPLRAVRLLVGFPDGGPVDIAGRTIGAWLSDRFGQAFHRKRTDPAKAATLPRARWSKLPRMATHCSYAAR